MRVASVEISGFRAFSGSERFDLDGDIVVVVGANGQGKTSLLDAIHWAVTGEISRLKSPGSVVSLYSASGEARVEVTIAFDDGRHLVVTRHSDGQKDRLLLRSNDSTFRGDDAEYELLRCLWPEGLAASESRAALRSALERGVYLQQDVLTDFLTADTDHNRFNAISELIGAGYTTEFQEALERSRMAWSRTTNQRIAGMKDIEGRLGRLEGWLRELTGPGSATATAPDEWNSWWTEVKRLGVSVAGIPRVESSDAASAIDRAMADLGAIRLSRERRGDRLSELAVALRDLPSTVFDLRVLSRTADEAAQALETARKTLADAEDRVAEVRKRQAETRLEQEDLKLLAEVALRHLEEHCPVCQQVYDRESTRERLETLIRGTGDGEWPSVIVPNLADIVESVQKMESEALAASATLREGQRQEQLRANGQARIRAGLAELTINVPEGSDTSDAIESALAENARDLEALSLARIQGEALALSLARTGQLARQAELDQERLQVSRELASVRTEIETRQETGELVSTMIDALRDVSSDLVERELHRLEPLLQRIYATADPHPEFRVVRLLSRMHRGRGRVLAEVEDPLHDQRSDLPSAFLSSSQMNVLAVSVFLALNLGIPTLPLRVAILDDPLQSLDDLNLLGLIDLLKRMRERRQLMISTHDSRFASLLERKLRPVAGSQRTIFVELSGWSNVGPVAMQRDIARDPMPIRIAAA